MLEAVLTHLHNWFAVGKHEGTYTIEGRSIDLPFLVTGQYYRITGSIFNDGLHQYGSTEQLTNETFTGEIDALAIPRAVINLSTEIETWCAKNGNASAFDSESFGGYSYSRSKNASGNAVTWMDVFRSRLNSWRKL